MKKKVLLTCLLVAAVGLTFTACGKGKKEPAQKPAENPVASTEETGERVLKFESGQFAIPCTVDDVVKAGWSTGVIDVKGTIVGGSGMGLDVTMDKDQRMTLVVMNPTDKDLEIGKCAVDGAQWSYKDENGLSCELEKGLKVTKDTTKENIKGTWGEPIAVSSISLATFGGLDDSTNLEFLQYQNETGFYEFAFSEDGKLMKVCIEKKEISVPEKTPEQKAEVEQIPEEVAEKPVEEKPVEEKKEEKVEEKKEEKKEKKAEEKKDSAEKKVEKKAEKAEGK